MIHIKKNAPPKKFLDFKLQNPNFHFDDMPSDVKNALRTSLLKEQGYLCAYCMSRINDEFDKVKIEHYNARTLDNELDYKNLLAVCTGNLAGSDLERQHCDTKKGNTPLHIDPQNPNHIKQISYKSNGTIYAKNNTDFDDDFNNTLNLNDEYGYLKINRKRALQEFKNKLHTMLGDKAATLEYCRKALHFYTTPVNGAFSPYCGIIIHYLLKRLHDL